MKALLFDDNISYRIKKKLKDHFEAFHISDFYTQATDVEVFHLARKNNYTIITFDSDLIELQILNGVPPKIIWLRTGNLRTHFIADRLLFEKDKIIEFISDNESGYLEVF